MNKSIAWTLVRRFSTSIIIVAIVVGRRLVRCDYDTRNLQSTKMPTSLFSEMDRGSNGGGGGVTFEDQRALQLAFELSMLGISSEGSSGCPGAGTGNGANNDPDPLQSAPAVFEEARSKKSQNMTECVPVPSSEHVAEIVGRQGKCVFLPASAKSYIVSLRAFFSSSGVSPAFIG